MKSKCDAATYPTGGPYCGKVFDDELYSTSCPHSALSYIKPLEGRTLNPRPRHKVKAVSVTGFNQMLQQEIEHVRGDIRVPEPILEAANVTDVATEEPAHARLQDSVRPVRSRSRSVDAVDAERKVSDMQRPKGAPKERSDATGEPDLSEALIDRLTTELKGLTYGTAQGERSVYDDCNLLLINISKRLTAFKERQGVT